MGETILKPPCWVQIKENIASNILNQWNWVSNFLDFIPIEFMTLGQKELDWKEGFLWENLHPLSNLINQKNSCVKNV